MYEPLTLEELWEMDGKPVYTIHKTGRGTVCKWSLVDANNGLVRNANGYVKLFTFYQKDWWAYRRELDAKT